MTPAQRRKHKDDPVTRALRVVSVKRKPDMTPADRQRIKRKAARWAARFSALKPEDRVAVRAAILALIEPKQHELRLEVKPDSTMELDCGCGHNGYDHGPGFCTGFLRNGGWCNCKGFRPSTQPLLSSPAGRDVKAGGGSEATQARGGTHAEVSTRASARKDQRASHQTGDTAGDEGLVQLRMWDVGEGESETQKKAGGSILAFENHRRALD